MIKVAICICTRKRPEGLKNLLLSINHMNIASSTDVSVIIVENDNTNLSEDLVKEFALDCRFKVKYALEKNQGISYARNRSVKEAGDVDFCCFVDDDQIVDADMLNELINCQNEFNADAVSGTTPPVFNYAVPDYIRQFHQDEVKPYGTIVRQAATGCLLIRKSLLDGIEGPFDLRMNFTGGEDFYMTYLFSENGGVIRANPDAISYEIIPEERATIKYVINRTIRTANTKMAVQELMQGSSMEGNSFPRTILRLINGLILLIPCLMFCKSNRLKGLIKTSYAVGSLMYFLGRKNKFYS